MAHIRGESGNSSAFVCRVSQVWSSEKNVDCFVVDSTQLLTFAFIGDISVLHQHGSSKSHKNHKLNHFLGYQTSELLHKGVNEEARQQEEGSGHAILSEQKELAKVMSEKAVVSEFLDLCPKLHRSGAESIKHPKMVAGCHSFNFKNISLCTLIHEGILYSSSCF